LSLCLIRPDFPPPGPPRVKTLTLPLPPLFCNLFPGCNKFVHPQFFMIVILFSRISLTLSLGRSTAPLSRFTLPPKGAFLSPPSTRPITLGPPSTLTLPPHFCEVLIPTLFYQKLCRGNPFLLNILASPSLLTFDGPKPTLTYPVLFSLPLSTFLPVSFRPGPTKKGSLGLRSRPI